MSIEFHLVRFVLYIVWHTDTLNRLIFAWVVDIVDCRTTRNPKPIYMLLLSHAYSIYMQWIHFAWKAIGRSCAQRGFVRCEHYVSRFEMKGNTRYPGLDEFIAPIMPIHRPTLHIWKKPQYTYIQTMFMFVPVCWWCVQAKQPVLDSHRGDTAILYSYSAAGEQ